MSRIGHDDKMLDLESRILLKTLQLFCIFLVGHVYVVCSKKTYNVPQSAVSQNVQRREPPKKEPKLVKVKKKEVVKEEAKEVVKEEAKEVGKDHLKEEKRTEVQKQEDPSEEVKFCINVKKQDNGTDVFDDDEENPAANIVITPLRLTKDENTARSAVSIPTATASPGPIPSSLPPMTSPSPYSPPQIALLAYNEKQIGASCYL